SSSVRHVTKNGNSTGAPNLPVDVLDDSHRNQIRLPKTDSLLGAGTRGVVKLHARMLREVKIYVAVVGQHYLARLDQGDKELTRRTARGTGGRGNDRQAGKRAARRSHAGIGEASAGASD